MAARLCIENLRDINAWSQEGLRMSVSSDQAAKMFDSAVRQLVSWTDCDQLGGLEGTVKRMREAEPEFLMGRVLNLGVNAIGTGHSIRTNAHYKSALDTLVADAQKSGNSRERRHARAVRLFAEGEMRSACTEWEKILAEHPNDILALKFSNDAYFFLGDPHGKRDNVARVIDKWDQQAPCYSYLHGMYAFGLEECGDYAGAERHARTALALQPVDCWATHALAHCYEMASNFNDGIRFMESTEADWAPGNFIACHNYWHVVLFYIEKGDFETALSLYDREVSRRTELGKTVLNLTDASSLLARFELEGIQVGRHRWEALAELAEQHMTDQVLPFNDAHIALVLNRLEREEKKGLASRHMENLEEFTRTGTGGCARVMRDLGLDACDAIAAFQAEQYERAFDALYPIRTQLIRMSGSHAQRDLFIQLLLNAGFRAGDQDRRAKAFIVLEERNRLQPNSTVAERLVQKHANNGPQ